jgi:hypothetical protein
MADTDDVATLLIYGRAPGSENPPLLMNPPADWTVKFFTKLGQRNLNVKLAPPVQAVRASDGTVLDPDTTLGELGMLPYEMIEFRSEA